VLIRAADFIREAIGKSVEINRATASWQTAHGLKWRRIRRVGVAVNVEIGDVAACAIVVDKVEEMEIRIAWVRVEAPSKIRCALEF
jgi:hypothetical protein